jgi:hypothetical protein
MLAFIGKVFMAVAALTGVVALIAGPTSAAHTASSAMSTIGITAGSMIGSIPAAVDGFQTARQSNSPASQQARRQQAAKAHRQMLANRKQRAQGNGPATSAPKKASPPSPSGGGNRSTEPSTD